MPENKLTFKEQIEAFKNELKDFFAGEPVKFADYKLDDGTIVRSDVDPIAVGAQVQSVSDAGTVPLADGEYNVVTDAGTISITVVSGFVTEAETQAAESTEPVEAATTLPPQSMDPTKATNSAPNSDMQPDVNKHAAMLADHETRLAKVEEAVKPAVAPAVAPAQMEAQEKKIKSLEKALEKSNEFSKKLFALVEELGNSTPEATHKPANRTLTHDETEREKIAKFRSQHKL